jgi:Skp family chaperone for outer membrane proteins
MELFQLVVSEPRLLWEALVMAVLIATGAWQFTRLLYDARLKGHADENARLQRKLEEAQRKLDDAQPMAILANQQALLELGRTEVRAVYTPQIQAKDEEIETLRNSLSASEKLSDRTKAQLNEMMQRLVSLEGEKRHLEDLRNAAFQFSDRLSRAVAHSVAKEGEEYERSKDSAFYIFIKQGDQRGEVARLQETSQNLKPEALRSVELVDGGKRTIARVVGQSWFETLTNSGWSNVPVAKMDSVSVAVMNWSDASRRLRASSTSFWHSPDHAVLEEEVGANVRRLVVLATLRKGWPYPMAAYFEGSTEAVEQEATSWLAKHRAKA